MIVYINVVYLSVFLCYNKLIEKFQFVGKMKMNKISHGFYDPWLILQQVII